MVNDIIRFNGQKWLAKSFRIIADKEFAESLQKFVSVNIFHL
jgi:hypothetical protein